MLRANIVTSKLKTKRNYVFLMLLAVGLFLGTAILLYNLSERPEQNGMVYLALINMNLLLLAILLVYAGRILLRLFIEKRQGLAGAGLRSKLLAVFSFLAVVPSVVVAAFSIVFLNLGVESWFSDRVTSALDGSLEVAQAYFEEHGNRLLSEVEVLAKDPTLKDPLFLIDPASIEELLTREKKQRNLAEISLYTPGGKLIAHAGDLPAISTQEVLGLLQDRALHARLFADYQDGRIVAITPVSERAILILTRWVTPAVLNHMDQTRAAYQEYYTLRAERGRMRLVFSMFFVVTTVAVLIAAVWSALTVAAKIIHPVRELVSASNRVRSGDLNTQALVMDDDELGTLATAFNQMTASMAENQRLLESQNRELDARRQAMEAVLTGVSAGVMSVDSTGVIRLANKTALDTLGVAVNKPLADASKELAALLNVFLETTDPIFTTQVRHLINGENCTLLVRFVPQEMRGDRKKFVVITFEDITTLLSAQRVSAWADMARRLAHEIKNPLTPIQLSAERIRRKYSKEISSDTETFAKLTTTITNQVEDMRQMLNEFSDFARMPAAKPEKISLQPLLEEVVTLQKEARPNLHFELDMPEENLLLEADAAHLKRLFINLIENAINAIEENLENSAQKNAQGEVKVVVFKSQGGKITIVVKDNGKGFSNTVDLDKLFDPYITTRKKGTGLGLAIVRKVVDEHHGQIRLMRGKNGGAEVEVTFPLALKTTQ